MSVCFFSDTDYVEDVAIDLGCLAGAPITVDNRAVAGWHSEDLLTPRNGGNANAQFIPNVVAARPDLITISIGGNDFLNTEPGQAGQRRPFVQADLNRSFQELIRTRRTVQEILSTLVSELPDADIEFNTVYDNLAPACATTDFHAATPPVWNAMLRNAAWGQVRPVVIAEVAPEFAHQNVTRTTCCGAQGQICAFDNIHPNASSALIIEEAVMESLGGLNVPAGGVSSGVAFGCQQLVATLAPTIVDVLGGSVSSPDEALVLDGTGATVGFDGARLELSGFALPAGVTPTRLVVGVRYRTTGVVTDDQHLFDASVQGFAAPQLNYTGWDTVTPLVGGSGTSGNLGTPSVVNALPNVPTWRDVSASVSFNALDDGTLTGEYSWPAPTAADVAALRVRLSTVTVGGVDPATVEWDGAWLWVYGTRPAPPAVPGEVSPPGAATPLTLRRAGADLVLDWQAEARSVDYRVFEAALGDWATPDAAPGAGRGGCSPSLSFTEALPVGDSFFLVAGVGAGGDQGPTGQRSDGTARAVGTATCP